MLDKKPVPGKALTWKIREVVSYFETPEEYTESQYTERIGDSNVN